MPDNLDSALRSGMYASIAAVAGLVLPLFLIPVVALTGYSEVVEELAKLAVIYFAILPLPNARLKFLVAAGFGLLFGLSENVLYFYSATQAGSLTTLLERCLITVPLHILTSVTILAAAQIRKRYIWVGCIVAVLLHLGFNWLVPLLS